jgi:hypothetical protein
MNFLRMFIKRIFLKADLGVIWDLPEFGRHLVEILADVPVPAPVQLSLVLDQAQPKVIRSETKFKDFKLNLHVRIGNLQYTVTKIRNKYSQK